MQKDRNNLSEKEFLKRILCSQCKKKENVFFKVTTICVE